MLVCSGDRRIDLLSYEWLQVLFGRAILGRYLATDSHTLRFATGLGSVTTQPERQLWDRPIFVGAK